MKCKNCKQELLTVFREETHYFSVLENGKRIAEKPHTEIETELKTSCCGTHFLDPETITTK